MRTISLIAVLAAFSAPAASRPTGQPSFGQRFAAMDADKNGQIDLAEFDRYHMTKFAKQVRDMDATFAVMDMDKNGQITAAEAANNPVIASVFDALDADKNRSLSKAELQSALAQSQAAEAAAP